MTAQSSSKSFFWTYLKYRLGALKLNFVMCCILNVLALPLFAISANEGFGGAISELALTGRVFSTMCIIALSLIAIFNAVLSFDYYNKKDMTDTIGVLPLTSRGRFFADLLAGYSVNIVPLVPCGIFCAVIFGNMQGKFIDIAEIEGGVSDFRMASLGIIFAVTLFLIVTFAYLFSVLITCCCGKAFHSVVFSVLGIAVLPLFFGGIAECFVNGMIAYDPKEYFFKAAAFFPPIGLIGDLFDAMDFPFTRWMIVSPLSRAEEMYAVAKPVYIAVYVLLAAGLIAGACIIGKRRLAENTGSAFAVKPMFFVICAGITAAVTITMLAKTYHTSERYMINSVLVGAVTCFVTILLNPMNKKKLLRSIVLGAGMIVIMVAVWILLDKTGSFGARYLPENAENIEYIRIDNTYRITDKADIEEYISLLNDKLRDIPNDVYYKEDGFCVEIKKTDGKTVERRYEYSVNKALYGASYYNNDNTVFEELIKQLDGYVGYFFDGLGDVSNGWVCRLITKTSDVEIPANKTKEFIAILREEASEKYRPNARIFAEVVIYADNASRTFEIKEDYERTIQFLEGMEENVEKDPESTYLSIAYNIRDEQWERFSVTIPYKDRDNEKVKELVSLLGEHSGKADNNFKIMSYYASGEQYVSTENTTRVLELMEGLAADYLNG